MGGAAGPSSKVGQGICTASGCRQGWHQAIRYILCAELKAWILNN